MLEIRGDRIRSLIYHKSKKFRSTTQYQNNDVDNYVFLDRLSWNNFNESQDFIDSFFSIIVNSLEQGNHVKISGFGNFMLRDKASRPGRNPKTKEEVVITERRVVTFGQTKKLMERVENYVRTHDD